MFVIVFCVLAIICPILYIYARTSSQTIGDPPFRSFQLRYLSVYGLAIAGDWLQGAHIYALYQSYEMTKHQIELLFIAGFGSSLIFGTIVGSFADKFGRKKNCILYAILYILACGANNFNNIFILFIGRLLGGIATSLLFSAFESWVISEHNARGFSSVQLGFLFSHQAFINSIVAILSGILAQYAVNWFGYVAPFNTAIVFLALMSLVAAFAWTENYGDKTAPLVGSFGNALKRIKSGSLLISKETAVDPNILCLGMVQSLFEGTMYTFVLEWTPALNKAAGSVDIPHGYIFATFMVAIMMGSSIFRILSRYCRPENSMRFVLLVAAVCMVVPIIFSANSAFVFGAFIIFEGCVGIFWPSISYLRGFYIPEEGRSTIMNLFRVPLNLIVILILLLDLPMLIIFVSCTIFLLLGAIFQFVLYWRTTISTTFNISGSDTPSNEVYSVMNNK